MIKTKATCNKAELKTNKNGGLGFIYTFVVKWNSQGDENNFIQIYSDEKLELGKEYFITITEIKK